MSCCRLDPGLKLLSKPCPRNELARRIQVIEGTGETALDAGERPGALQKVATDAGKRQWQSGDPGWIRTIDLPLRRRPLYPLSYEAPVWRCPTRYMRANAPPCKVFEC